MQRQTIQEKSKPWRYTRTYSIIKCWGSSRDPNSGKKSIAKAKRMRLFFEKNCEAKAKRTSNYFLRIRFAFAVFAELQENLKENFSHKNCAKFFAYFSFALFFTVFLKIGTNRISLMKKYIISPTRPSVLNLKIFVELSWAWPMKNFAELSWAGPDQNFPELSWAELNLI
jgi:hypothetical protein